MESRLMSHRIRSISWGMKDESLWCGGCWRFIRGMLGMTTAIGDNLSRPCIISDKYHLKFKVIVRANVC
ncbi:hypothetical protein MPTK1_5g22090 [Marchantia polymorpha subsp. ruderalis]|uniref:Uncharacterized protein n=2 Tax=Marchantia polymorpha TaxID=3197 RepID=A0AAF6BL03_MARPO|nr:hypothetical protein MARPO_0166s0003 [Marchantia polymorpha]BBN12687.1 hypothetical protein Mp_5g22090 [Marchantia polymorpha subsp. ruderalis]|eukprot:PTQ28343.1 hypothetical protein MARPO_0166s0003 [Marchantia polymorpha]